MLRPIVPFGTYSGLQRVVAIQHVLSSPARTALKTPCFKIILKHIHFVLGKKLSTGDAAKLLQEEATRIISFQSTIENYSIIVFFREESLTNCCFPIGALHFKPRTEMKLSLSQFTKAQTFLSPLSFSLKLEQSNQTCTYPNKHQTKLKFKAPKSILK